MEVNRDILIMAYSGIFALLLIIPIGKYFFFLVDAFAPVGNLNYDPFLKGIIVIFILPTFGFAFFKFAC